MDNLFYLNGKVDIWLRVPLIPGFYDDNDTIRKIIDLAKQIHIQKLYFLPYHKLGIGKYTRLGRVYLLSEIESISDEKFENIHHICQSSQYSNFEIEKQPI